MDRVHLGVGNFEIARQARAPHPGPVVTAGNRVVLVSCLQSDRARGAMAARRTRMGTALAGTHLRRRGLTRAILATTASVTSYTAVAAT